MAQRRLELYGTLGPACQREETLEGMFRAGMTGIRLNLSHVALADCGQGQLCPKQARVLLWTDEIPGLPWARRSGCFSQAHVLRKTIYRFSREETAKRKGFCSKRLRQC